MCCKVIFAIKKQNLWYFSELLMLMFKFPQTSEANIHGVFINLNKHKLFTRIMSQGKAHAQRTELPFLSNGGTVFFETRHTLVDCVVLIFIWEICADVFHPLHGLVFLHNHWPVHHVFEPQGAVPVVWHTKKSPYNKYRKDFLYCCKSYHIISSFCSISTEYLPSGATWVFLLTTFFNHPALCAKRSTDRESENASMSSSSLMYSSAWTLHSLPEKEIFH